MPPRRTWIGRRSPANRNVPAALTIAGSDSGGGAGIQADLHTFAALGVHGTTAITCITAQNPRRVSAIEPCSPEMLRKQLEAVWDGFAPAAAKTGMLFSTDLIRVVRRFFAKRPGVRLVLDPVMVSTSGARLLKPDALKTLEGDLFPLAALITPNVAEAELLLRATIQSPLDLRRAAREMHKRYGCAVLAKGGHLAGARQAIDIFYDGRNELLLSAQFIRGRRTHGTGCTYSAAIAAYLAKGEPLERAVEQAKQFVTQAIARTRFVRDQQVLFFG
jgi:hydroxymethylpyrimidine/phosphomethylpyrimidine kinase